MRTFRSLSLLSSSSQYFKPKFPNKKTFCPHFARCGLASLAPVTCRAAVVYGQGKPLQVEFALNSTSFDLPVNNSQIFLGWAGRGFASWTWRGETFTKIVVNARHETCRCVFASCLLQYATLTSGCGKEKTEGWWLLSPWFLAMKVLVWVEKVLHFFCNLYLCRSRGSWSYWWRSEWCGGELNCIYLNFASWVWFGCSTKMSGWGPCDTLWVASLWQVCSLSPS